MAPPIAILGAGPSGLTLARLLHLNGIDYTIFERDASAASAWGRGGSGTLDLHEGSGLLALQEAGLLDEFKRKARYDVPLVIADMHGDVKVRQDNDGNTDRPEIDRRDLRLMLLDAVPREKLQWGKKIEEVLKQETGEMAVRFTDGSSESGFQLVVGADGAWSKCRRLVTSTTPQFAGRYYITSNIAPSNPFHPVVEALAGTGNYMSMGGRRVMTAMRLGDRSYYSFAGISLPESWKSDNADLLKDPTKLKRELVAKHFADWPKATTDLMTNSDGDIYTWPLYGVPAGKVGWETVPGVTLIGDAAHPCPPGGDGVNVAMHDSLELAHQIIKFGIEGLDNAIEEYEKLMLPRAIAMIKDSAMMNEAMFAEDSPAPLLKVFEGFGAEQDN